MPKVPNYTPQPGVQKPEKYPFVGSNYKLYGEQPGFIYDPYRDQYYADRRTPEQKKLEEEGPPKPPGLADTLVPIAGVGGALWAGKELGKFGADKLTGLLKTGEKAAPALGEAVTAGTAATEGAGGLAGAASGASGAAGAGAGAGEAAASGMFELGGIGSAGNVILPAAGAIGAYDVLANDRGPARGGLQGAASGAALGSYFGPQGALIGAGIGGTIGLAKGLFGDHESTRDVAKKHTSELAKMGANDSGWQSYLQGMRAQYNEAPPDPSKPFNGKYGSWDEYRQAGLDANNLTGVYGNLKVYGPEWAKLTQAQRVAITQANIDSGIYDSKKGEVVITDTAAALANKDKVLNPKPAAPQPSGAKPTGMLDTSPRPAIDPSKLDPNKIDPGFNVRR